MAASAEEAPQVRKVDLGRGKAAFIMKRPYRGKRRQEIPEDVVESLYLALSSLSLAVGEGVAVPKDDLSEPRVFEKNSQASNFGRKLTKELEEKADLGELTRSIRAVDGGFALLLSKKEKADAA